MWASDASHALLITEIIATVLNCLKQMWCWKHKDTCTIYMVILTNTVTESCLEWGGEGVRESRERSPNQSDFQPFPSAELLPKQAIRKHTINLLNRLHILMWHGHIRILSVCLGNCARQVYHPYTSLCEANLP